MSCRRVFSLQSFNVNSMVDKSIDHGKMLIFFNNIDRSLRPCPAKFLSHSCRREKEKKSCHPHIISIICILIDHSSRPISREKLLDQLLLRCRFLAASCLSPPSPSLDPKIWSDWWTKQLIDWLCGSLVNFQLDVVRQNYVPGKQGKRGALVYTKIDHVAFNDDGQWLATVSVWAYKIMILLD